LEKNNIVVDLNNTGTSASIESDIPVLGSATWTDSRLATTVFDVDSLSGSCSTLQDNNIFVEMISELGNDMDLFCIDNYLDIGLLSLCEMKLNETLFVPLSNETLLINETLLNDFDNLSGSSIVPKKSTLIKPLMDVDVQKPPKPLNRGGYVPTTASLTLCLKSLEKHLAGDEDYDYIIEGVSNGFRIIDEKVFPVTAACKNYRSATLTNRDASEAQIKTEIDLDRYIIA
jgi:hypothetical protein